MVVILIHIFIRPASNNLAFVTNNEERLRIKADGNVGIGTNDPDFLLTVGADKGFKVPTAGTIIANRNMAIQTVYPILQLIDTDSNSDFQIQNANGAFGIRDTTNSANRLVIKSDGNVGINTDSPLVALHVKSGAGAGYTATFNSRTAAVIDGDNANGTTLSIISKSSGFSGLFFGRPNSEARGQIQYVHSDDAFRIITAGGGMDALRIKSDNKVGINTDSPSTLLQIVGSTASTDSSGGTLGIEAKG